MSSSEAVTGSILNNIASSYNDTTAEKNTSTLDQEAFLTLLVAQMQNQDPLNPMDGTEYTSQLAQFSALEQQITTNATLSEISAKLDESSDYPLLDFIGKEIVFSSGSDDSTSEGTTETGRVDGISFVDGKAYLTVNEILVDPNDVVDVGVSDSTT
jgi:flagellar hook assembly protein FlgD